MANLLAASKGMGAPGQQAAGPLGSTVALTYVALFLFSPVIEEGGVKMKLTVIDTPGFGDQINNENWCVPASEILFLNTPLGRHSADSFPLRMTCILLDWVPWVKSSRANHPWKAIHGEAEGEPVIGERREARM